MGYYITGEGQITVRKDNLDKAYSLLCALNDADDLKRGGSFGGAGVTSNDPRPDGMSYHPARWFSWMDANYPDTTNDFYGILTMLGFDYIVDDDDENVVVITLTYDNKMGQEDLFLNAIAPIVESGMVDWRGEDGMMWRDEFTDGVLVQKRGRVIYVYD